MFGWFKRKPIEDKIKIGSTWEVKPDDGDPFPTSGHSVTTVLDVKNGWVKFKIGSGFIFDDERMKIRLFLYCYREIK